MEKVLRQFRSVLQRCRNRNSEQNGKLQQQTKAKLCVIETEHEVEVLLSMQSIMKWKYETWEKNMQRQTQTSGHSAQNEERDGREWRERSTCNSYITVLTF